MQHRKHRRRAQIRTVTNTGDRFPTPCRTSENLSAYGVELSPLSPTCRSSILSSASSRTDRLTYAKSGTRGIGVLVPCLQAISRKTLNSTHSDNPIIQMKLSTRFVLPLFLGLITLLPGCVMAPLLVADSPLNGTPKPMQRLILVVNPGVGYVPQLRPSDMEYLSALKVQMSTAFLAKNVSARILDDFPYKVVELSPTSPNVNDLGLAISADQPTHVIRMTVVKAMVNQFKIPLRVTWQFEILQAENPTTRSNKNFSSISTVHFEGPGCSAALAATNQCVVKLAAELIMTLQRKGFLGS